jgi:surface antigen
MGRLSTSRLATLVAAVILAAAAGYWLTGGEPEAVRWTTPQAEAAPMTAAAPAAAPDAACEERPRTVVIDRREVSAFATICPQADGSMELAALPPPAVSGTSQPGSDLPAAEVAPEKPRHGKGPKEVFLASSRAIRLAGQRRPAGSVRLERSWTGPAGQICHDYEQRVTVKGKNLRSTGTVCQRKDGSWAMHTERNVKAASSR